MSTNEAQGHVRRWRGPGRAPGVVPSFGGIFDDTASAEMYTLSLHDALPISATRLESRRVRLRLAQEARRTSSPTPLCETERSEEHTSELQSHVNLVCRLLPEKKKPYATPTRATNGRGLARTSPSNSFASRSR